MPQQLPLVFALAGSLCTIMFAGSAYGADVTIAASADWTATGVNAVAGRSLTIKATGLAGYGSGGPQSCRCGGGACLTPDGCADEPICWADPMHTEVTAPCGMLMGRIADGTPFTVGHERTLVADTSGPLFLTLNDFPAEKGNNVGSFTVTISGGEDVVVDIGVDASQPQALRYTLTLKNQGGSDAEGVKLSAKVSPRFTVRAPSMVSPAPSSTRWTDAATGELGWNVGKLARGASKTFTYTLVPEWLTVADGALIAIGGPGAAPWPGDGWTTSPRDSNATSGATVSQQGGALVLSDQPESIEAGEPEGVLYRTEGPVTDAFRIYAYHYNKTPDALSILYVLRNQTANPITVQCVAAGVGGTGQVAMREYMASRSGAGCGAAGSRYAQPIPAHGALVIPVAGSSEGAIKGALAPTVGVATIEDLTTSGPIEVGIVAIKADREPSFAADPLAAPLVGGASYGASPLMQPRNTVQTRGTFDHNERLVALPDFEAKSWTRYAFRIGEDVTGAVAGEYEQKRGGATRDGVPIDVEGNYGVMYRIRFRIKDGGPQRPVQLLLDSRGGDGQYFGFAQLDGGAPITIRNIDAGTTLLGLARISDASPHELLIMPTGGATLPVALVFEPSFVHTEAEVAWTGARAPSTSDDDTVIAPGTAAAPPAMAEPSPTPTPTLPPSSSGSGGCAVTGRGDLAALAVLALAAAWWRRRGRVA